MKKYLLTLLICSSLISGCGVFSKNGKDPYRKKGEPEIEVSPYGQQAHEILVEANRLADLVNKNELTRVQAAQSLDQYRVKLVGHNAVDDSVFAVYLRVAIDRQKGKIDAQKAQNMMQVELTKWQTRWGSLKKKPENPAFTNFLMQVFKQPPLK